MRTITGVLLLTVLAATTGCSSAMNRFDSPYFAEVRDHMLRVYVGQSFANQYASASINGFDGTRLYPFVQILEIRPLKGSKIMVTESMSGWGGDEKAAVYTAKELSQGRSTQTYWGASLTGKRWRGMALKWPPGGSLEVSIADSFGNRFQFTMPEGITGREPRTTTKPTER